jgi:K+-sensing histidine kinase KdpD
MKDKLLRFPFTSAAAMFAVFVVSAALIGDINLIDFPVLVMNRIEKHEVDDIFTALLLLIVALIVDQIRAARREKREAQRQAEQRKAELQAEQVRVVQVTMRTVQDIVNNCLNQLQLLRLDAEDIVPAESLRLFDEAIQQTSSQLKTLGDLEVFAESQMAVGSGLDASIRGRAR